MAAELTDYLLREFKIEVLPNAREDDMAVITVGTLLRLAALAQAAQGAEPVATVHILRTLHSERMVAHFDVILPEGTKLYTAPPPTAEVEKKAARYDWLRAIPLFGAWDVARVRPNREWLIDSLRADELDAAIDAAIQSDQAQAGKGDGNDQ